MNNPIPRSKIFVIIPTILFVGALVYIVYLVLLSFTTLHRFNDVYSSIQLPATLNFTKKDVYRSYGGVPLTVSYVFSTNSGLTTVAQQISSSLSKARLQQYGHQFIQDDDFSLEARNYKKHVDVTADLVNVNYGSRTVSSVVITESSF